MTMLKLIAYSSISSSTATVDQLGCLWSPRASPTDSTILRIPRGGNDFLNKHEISCGREVE